MFNILHMWSDLFQDPNWRRQKQIGSGVLRAEDRLVKQKEFIRIIEKEKSPLFSLPRQKSRQVLRAEERRHLKNVRINMKARAMKDMKLRTFARVG
jgi:hypothetical protein